MHVCVCVCVGGEGKRKESQSSISDLAGSDGCSPSTTEGGGAAKKSRLVFTDIQRRTLLAIFKETKRPSRDMQVRQWLHVSVMFNSFKAQLLQLVVTVSLLL